MTDNSLAVSLELAKVKALETNSVPDSVMVLQQETARAKLQAKAMALSLESDLIALNLIAQIRLREGSASARSKTADWELGLIKMLDWELDWQNQPPTPRFPLPKQKALEKHTRPKDLAKQILNPQKR